jgi:hypothetical protein
VATPIFLLHISFSWVEIRLHTECQLPMLLRSGSLMVRDDKKAKLSMKLMASLAPSQAEINAGVVGDQKDILLVETAILRILTNKKIVFWIVWTFVCTKTSDHQRQE